MRQFPKNLTEALQARECILFIGSGISQWSGLPSWESLLRRMIGFLEACSLLKDFEKTEIEGMIKNGDLLTAASLCSSQMRKADLSEFMDTVFVKPNPVPHEIHKIIVDLGPDSFVTTNYDRLIDEAYQLVHKGLALSHVNNDQPIEQAKIMKHGASRFIFTPHGRADEIGTIILSREDYRRIQYDSETVMSSLEHLFISRPVIYLGFGLRDPDFLMIKDRIYATFHGAEREHFAIMPDVSDMFKEFWRNSYGINIISYSTQPLGNDGQQPKGSHEELLRLLEALRAELKAPALNQVTAAVRIRRVTTMRSALIRFCEDIVHSSPGIQDRAPIFASFRADYSPSETNELIAIQRRSLPVLELLDVVTNLVVIGSPGSGKTCAVQTYSVILAQRALKALSSSEMKGDREIKQIIPLILSMREYSGNIEDMITERLPRSLDVPAALQAGVFVLILDAINEVPQSLAQEGILSRDITSFFAKYPSNRFILTSRAMHFVPPVTLPVFELQPIRGLDLFNYLKSKTITPEKLTSPMWETLRNPMLLSMFVLLRERSAEIVNVSTLLRFYFEELARKFAAASNAKISLMAVLAPLAYSLLSEGSQTMTAGMIERELEEALAGETPDKKVGPAKILKSLIISGVLVPDAEGNVGFFHQTALEYVGAIELLSRFDKRSLSIRKLLDLHRWDETIVLFVALLPPERRKEVMDEISKIDILLACRAFESAAIRDESVGLLLFDAIEKRLANTRLPQSQKRAIAHALTYLAPYGRKEALAKLLSDKIIGGSAAIALSAMGVKEFIPDIISCMLEDNTWPSDFAKALEVIADESLVKELIARRSPDRDSLVNMNLATVLRHFESDALYSEIERLRSAKEWDREFAARLLSELDSERSKSILAGMLSDSNSDVRYEAIRAMRESHYRTDMVVSRMFDLLADKDSGRWAADYLVEILDSSIHNEVTSRIAQPRNDHEVINLCVVLARSDPHRARALLFERLRKYDPSYRRELYAALSELPVEYLLPDILRFLHVEDLSLRLTVVEALRGVDQDRLPISEDDCAYLLSMWERTRESSEEEYWLKYSSGELLGTKFQAVSKPLLLKRLASPEYASRLQLLSVVSRMTLNEGDLSSELVDWIISEFDLRMPSFGMPVAEIAGKVVTESEVGQKLIPLLSSRNSLVRDNAYVAIMRAEHRLGKRFLKEPEK